MATVSQTIPNYYGGLSEQPDELKIPGQVNKLINTLPDITHGLMKRPGGRLIGTGSMGSYTTDSKWFHYYRDENEQYIGQIELSSGSVKMWRCDTGASVTVLMSSTTAIKNYLKTYTDNTHDGSDGGTVPIDSDIQTLTLNDHTYLTNRNKIPAMASTVFPVRPPEAYVELKKVAYASQYSLNIFDDTSTDEVYTATRIDIQRDRDSSNTCDSSGDPPTAGNGTFPGDSGYTSRCDKDAGIEFGDSLTPNVATQIFKIDNGQSGDASEANGNAHTFTVTTNGRSTTDRKNLYFRITTLGQSVAINQAASGDIYRSRYTTTFDLLYGGEGWGTGDYFYVWMKNARYKVTIKEHSVAKIQGNLGIFNPSPTSFDSKTTVTAESVLGSLRRAIENKDTANTPDPDDFIDSAGASVTQIGNGLYITRNSVLDSDGDETKNFNVTTGADTLLNVFSNTVKDIEDLPSQCKHGYVVRVANSVADEDDYYVKFVGSGKKDDGTHLDGPGTWEECAEPGRKIAFDPATMPIELVRLSNGSFYLTQLNGSTGSDIPGGSLAIPTSAINTSTGVITISNHGLSTNDKVKYYDGGGQSWTIQGDAWPIVEPYTFYVTKVDDNTFKIGKSQGSTDTFHQAGNNDQYIFIHLVDYTPPSWDNCLVGDDVTVEEPSFITSGKGINKMLFFRNRMVILSDESVIMSRPGAFFNFWPKTAVTYTATDQIDISCSSEFPAVVQDGIQVNSGLLLFTKNQQFMLTTDSDVLSPNTAKINALATYNFNHKTNPISMGTTVAFLDNGGKFSRFFEISAVLREGQPEVLEQSKAVSKSFPKDIDIIANSRENSVIFFAKTGDSKVYGYRYFSGIEKRVQQAWFQWELSGDIQHMAMLDDALYVVIRNRDTDVLQKFNLKIDDDSNVLTDDRGTLTDDSDDITHRVHLDNAFVTSSSSLVYDSNSNLTAFSIPSTAFKKTITTAGTAPTYSRSSGSSIVTITYTNHGFKVGQIIHVEYTSGSLDLNAENNPAKNATILTASDNSFTIDSQGTAASSGEAVLQALSAVMIVATGDDKKFHGYTQRTRIQDSSGTTIVLMDGNWKTYESGGSTITPTNNIIFGYLYDMEVGFPTIYKQDRVGETSYKADVHSSLILHRVKLSLGPSSVFDIIAKKNNKDTYTESFTGLDPDEVVTDRPVIQPDQKITIPIYEKNINLELAMKSTHASPATLYSLTWEGDYTDAYYKRV